MVCKVKQNGQIIHPKKPQPKPAHEDVICSTCDGDGLLLGKVCSSCNGHGIVVLDSNSKPHSYSPNFEQLKAMEILGKIQ